MIFKTLFLVISLHSFSNQTCCEFDKDCFTIFVRSLYSRGVLSKESKNHVVLFSEAKYKGSFVRKIKVGNKTLCLKLTKSDNLNGVLNIVSIKQTASQQLVVDFTIKEGGGLTDGTVVLGFSDNKPIFLNARVIRAIE